MNTKLDHSKTFSGLVPRVPRSTRAVINWAERFPGPYEIEVAFVSGNLSQEPVHDIKLMSANGEIISMSEFSEENLEEMKKVVQELNLEIIPESQQPRIYSRLFFIL